LIRLDAEALRQVRWKALQTQTN